MAEATTAPILVVEDDADIRETIAAILELEGYAVELASNGQEAVSAIDHQQPRLVLLDMRMPVLDGWGFARVVRERGLKVPIIVMTAAQDAGRWAMTRRSGWRIADSGSTEAPASPQAGDMDAIEHVCRSLLRRWGVVFWKLLERESDWLPPWRQILLCLRRLEARGEIRGGRFVAGFSGEQFALPEAVGLLREARRKPHDGALISLSAGDPLNLIGILTPGARLPSLTGNRLLYRDGVPVAVYAGGNVTFLEQLEPPDQWQVQSALLRRQVPAPLMHLG